MRSRSNGLAMVATIYEEEDPEEDPSACNSKPPSPAAASSSSSSPLSPLEARVEDWSRLTGSKPDVVIRVGDQCFNLHKEPLASHSRYLRHRLYHSSSDVPILLPSPVSANTFATIATFCYGADLPLTPSNVAAIHVTAEVLQMSSGAAGSEDLLQRAEWYFRQAVAAGADCALFVLRTCLALLPSASGHAAVIAARCIEALAGGGSEEKAWVEALGSTEAGEFQMVVVSLRARELESHDLLYEIVDHYLKCRAGELSEDEKSRICASVDCKRLTRPCLVDLVQNPRMPLRFVVQAMLVEQFHARAAVVHGISKAAASAPVTLGDILRREAALRQVGSLRAAMSATSFRIRSLEEELAELRRMLREERDEGSRSASFRLYAEEKREEGRRRKKGLGRMVVGGIARVLRGTVKMEKGSFGCRGDGDVVRLEELRRHSIV